MANTAMTNKELISKLNNLKNVNPDQSWLKSNRDLLLSQISNSGAENLSAWKVFVINFNSVMKAASRPASALGVFVLVLMTGLFSHQIFAKTKPNDSLYIARIISEKVKLNTVFNSQDRDKLAVQFASEHARDISAVLADPTFNNEENQDQVARLSDSFNKEVNTVKSRISKISPDSVSGPNQEAADEVVIAESAKDDKGIQIAEGTPEGKVEAVAVDAADNAPLAQELASTTVVGSEIATSTDVGAISESVAPLDTDKILDEAKELFDKKDYNSVLNKLKEVEESIK